MKIVIESTEKPTMEIEDINGCIWITITGEEKITLEFSLFEFEKGIAAFQASENYERDIK